MTRDDIIRMTEEAGWSGVYMQWTEPTGRPEWSPAEESVPIPLKMEQIVRLKEIVAASEREACAEVCRQMARRTQDIRSAALQEAADNILARGENT